MLKSWNAEIMKCWNAEMLKYWNAKMMKCWRAEIMNFWNMKCGKNVMMILWNDGWNWLEWAGIGRNGLEKAEIGWNMLYYEKTWLEYAFICPTLNWCILSLFVYIIFQSLVLICPVLFHLIIFFSPLFHSFTILILHSLTDPV